MAQYLEALTRRLSEGVARLPAERWRPHRDYLVAAQRPDGGFAGREGDSDLYYTGFALRSLALLGELRGPVADRAADYLRGAMHGQAQIIDFLSLLYSALLLQTSAGVDVFEQADPQWPEAVAATLQSLRREDGGYVKALESPSSSTYHTFLVMLCLQLIGRETPEPQRTAEFLRSRRREDGGFVEVAAMRRSGTNPTAAAVAALRILEALDEETRLGSVEFLVELQTDEGGIAANTRIPFADLLSTFTGLLTLIDAGGARELQLPALQRYVRGLAAPTGGFGMASLDPITDVEYTFYGLGCLALLEELI